MKFKIRISQLIVKILLQQRSLSQGSSSNKSNKVDSIETGRIVIADLLP